MPWTSKPFAGTARAINDESEQRRYYGHLGDGIINARRMGAGLLIADGTSVLRFQPVDVKLRGLWGYLDAEEPWNLATLAPAPGVGRSRIDSLVVRLDTNQKEIFSAVVPGVAAVTPTPPALKWDQAGIWELELWSWRYDGRGLTQDALSDRRSWLGSHHVLADDAPLRETVDIGSTAEKKGLLWTRKPVSFTKVEWVPARRFAAGFYNDVVGPNSIVTIVHDLGVVPRSVQLTQRSTGNDEVDGITVLLEVTSSTTQTQVVVRRSDLFGTPARAGRPLAPGNPCHFYWEVSA